MPALQISYRFWQANHNLAAVDPPDWKGIGQSLDSFGDKIAQEVKGTAKEIGHAFESLGKDLGKIFGGKDKDGH